MPTLYEGRRKGRKVTNDALFLEEIEPPQKTAVVHFDNHRDAPKGFGVRTTPKGTHSFVLRYTSTDGRNRYHAIGRSPTWTLAAARTEATAKRRDIDAGNDPNERRQQARRERRVADVAESFLASKSDLGSGEEIASLLRRRLIPRLGNQKIAEVRRSDVKAVIQEVADEHPRTAGILLNYTKQLFAYAEDWEMIEANPVATLKASQVGRGLTSAKRDRVLTDDEVHTLWTLPEVPEGMSPVVLLALRMILVTGQRPGEVAGMRWHEIKGSTWTIPSERRGKTETAHTVPLTESALKLLERAAEISPERHGPVFSTKPDVPLGASSIAKAVLRCAAVLGMDPAAARWRPHDLRRTVRTGLSAAGVGATVAELTVGHTLKGISAVYDRHTYDAEKRAALEAWEARLLRLPTAIPPQ